MTERTKDGLRILQALPLDLKIEMSKQRIREWYEHFDGMVYIGFSGGKDSSVLLHLVRSIYPDIPAVYCDTGLEFPELKELVRSTENTEIVRPKLVFTEVLTRYGYPLVSKEVAEAIYYARRNAAPTDRQTDTPERKRDELLDQRRNSDGATCSAYGDRRQAIRMQLGLLANDPHRGGWSSRRSTDFLHSETFIKRTELLSLYQNERDTTRQRVVVSANAQADGQSQPQEPG